MNAQLLIKFAGVILPVALFGQTAPPPAYLLNPVGSNLEDAFQVNYTANLNLADAVVNVANAGSSAANVAPTSSNTSGDVCVNVYVYRPTEQLAACCSCATTPNGLYSWPVIYGSSALLANATNKPNSVVIKVVATSPATSSTATNIVCDPTFGTAPLSLVPGLAVWGTHIHATPTSTIGLTETAFNKPGLSLGEATKLQNDCAALGSGQRCPGCLNMGLAQPAPATALKPSLGGM